MPYPLDHVLGEALWSILTNWVIKDPGFRGTKSSCWMIPAPSSEFIYLISALDGAISGGGYCSRFRAAPVAVIVSAGVIPTTGA